MFKCDHCGSTVSHVELTSEGFEIDGKRVLIDHIPAIVCKNCGEFTFSRATTEKVRRMAHGEAVPISVVTMEVFEYA